MKRKHLIACMESAEAWAKCSVGERLKVGCVITKPGGGIIAEGYNGLPSCMDGPLEDENYKTKPQVIHAEINALKKITRSHESSVGAWVFVTHSPCEGCAIDLIDADIDRVYYRDLYRSADGIELLERNGIKVIQLRTEKSLDKLDE